VKAKFESYFVKRCNTIYERAKFNRRKQEVNETVDEFITDLYCLVEHCDFGALHDELVQVRSWQQRQQTLEETTDGV